MMLLRRLYYSSFCNSVASVSAGVFFSTQILYCIVLYCIENNDSQEQLVERISKIGTATFSHHLENLQTIRCAFWPRVCYAITITERCAMSSYYFQNFITC